MSKSVCYFGSYDRDYSRNRIIIKGLKKNGITVYECQANGFFVSRFYKLIKSFLTDQLKYKTIIVGFPGWFDLPLAYILAKIFNKKLIFDVFTPLYESYFLDRKQVRFGFLYLWLDRLNMKLSDKVLADTKTHLREYVNNYGLKLDKGIVVYVGVDNEIFYPRDVKESVDVLFYGSYQPLQGIEYIVKAASKLPKVSFKLIGEGQTRKRIEELVLTHSLKNVEFVDWLPIDELAVEICKAKVILGIFGSSVKALSVVPNKVYDGLASRKAVLTMKTTASEELLVSKKNCVLVSDLNKLDQKISKLLKNQSLRKFIAKNGYDLMKQKLMPKQIVKPLIGYLK